MRKIAGIEVFFGILILFACLGQSLGLGWVVHRLLPRFAYREMAVCAVNGAWFLGTYFAMFGFLVRTLLKLPEGEIPPGSSSMRSYHVRLMLQFFVTHPLLRSNILPVPLSRLAYQLMGARMGANSYSSGMIFDPDFVIIGENALLGHGSVLIPHVIENDRLSHHLIRIGNRVTVGAHAVVMAGAVIEDDAIVAVGAVVSKNSRIGAGEVWGGVPARRIQ